MAASKKLKIKDHDTDCSEAKEQEINQDKEIQAEGQLTVDVFETDSEFVVMSTVAGIVAKDIEIQVDKDMLVIKGCRPNPGIEGNKNYFYQECYWGPFSRKIILPENIDSAHPEAEFNKGLLTVKFSKNPGKDKKDISVKES